MDAYIQKLEATELDRFIDLIDLFEAVFEMDEFKAPPPAHLGAVLSDPRFIALVAVLDNAVVGGLTAHVLPQYYSTRQQAYIYDLAVATEHQRKGIGAALIGSMTAFAQVQGFDVVFVQAERADKHAVDFYRKTHPTAEEDVVHFSYTIGGTPLDSRLIK